MLANLADLAEMPVTEVSWACGAGSTLTPAFFLRAGLSSFGEEATGARIAGDVEGLAGFDFVTPCVAVGAWIPSFVLAVPAPVELGSRADGVLIVVRSSREEMFSSWRWGDEGIGGNDAFLLRLCRSFFGELGGEGAERIIAGGTPGEGGGLWISTIGHSVQFPSRDSLDIYCCCREC